MKKSLLSSSAIVGAAVMAAASAPAFAGSVESSDTLTVSLEGTLRFNTYWFDQDITTGRGRGYDFGVDEAEIEITAMGVADNGLVYGFEMELQTQTNDQDNVDESQLFFSGDWGRLELGDEDGASDAMEISADTIFGVGRGGWDGDVGDVFVLPGGVVGSGVSITGDATKASYYTPRFFGFQLGASWTPDSGGAGTNFGSGGRAPAIGAGFDDNPGNFENVWEAGLNFVESFNGVGIQAGVVASGGDGEFPCTGSTDGAGVPTGCDNLDAFTWAAGATVSYAGFSLGGGYFSQEEVAGIADPAVAGGTLEVDAGNAWNVAAVYETGPWGVGVGYFYSEADNSHVAGAADSSVEIITISAGYTVAPGLRLATDVNFVDAENVTRTAGGADNEGFVWVLATTVSF